MYGSDFRKFPGIAYMRTPENLKIWCVFVVKLQEMGTFFSEKSLNMGTYLGQITPKRGYGSWAAGGTSPTIPNLSTPQGAEADTLKC